MCFLAHPLPPQRAGTRTVMLPWSRGHTLPASLVPSIAQGWNPFRTSWKIVILGFHPWRSHSIGLGYGLRICIFKKHSRQSWVFLKNQCSIDWSPTRNLKCSLPQQIQSPFSHLLLPSTALFKTISQTDPKHPLLFTLVPPTNSTHSIIILSFLCMFIVSLPRMPAAGRHSAMHLAGGQRICLYSLWSCWVHPSSQILPNDCVPPPYFKKNPIVWKSGKCDSLDWNRSDAPAPTRKKGCWVTLQFYSETGVPEDGDFVLCLFYVIFISQRHLMLTIK